ncbi:MAG: aminoacyl-tRNA hydrolase [Propionibacteriaceae bacterium]|jgi:ribosome-associated protein|nr:aminoacyl-tRNA hydrolase [Propionibacteriaceae bacterium]
MDDLHIRPVRGAPDGITIPAAELTERFSHSSGPGGQGVNTSDSRVQLSLDIATTTSLDDAQRTRALERLSARLSDGVLTITASAHRSQRQNRALARERLAAIIREAVTPPTSRRRTTPTRASKLRRLEAKKRRSDLKHERRRPHAD